MSLIAFVFHFMLHINLCSFSPRVEIILVLTVGLKYLCLWSCPKFCKTSVKGLLLGEILKQRKTIYIYPVHIMFSSFFFQFDLLVLYIDNLVKHQICEKSKAISMSKLPKQDWRKSFIADRLTCLSPSITCF